MNQIWSALGAKDRGIRHAARVALEKQPIEKWKNKLSSEKNPVVASAAMIALARADSKSSGAVLSKAMTLDYANEKELAATDRFAPFHHSRPHPWWAATTRTKEKTHRVAR